MLLNRVGIRPAATPLRSWSTLLLGGCLLAGAAKGQEAIQNLMKGDASADSRARQMRDEDYTLKTSDFRMLLTPSMGSEWNDNVNVSDNNRMDDFILKPALGITSSYQLTQRNLLFLDVTLGYDRYLKHPNLSTFDMNSSSGTGLSFDIGVQDFTFNLHDWVSYVQNSSQNAQVANTATYGTFENTSGLSADWDLNKAMLSAGYDHQIVKATSASFDNISHSSEMFFFRPSLQLHPQVKVGLETTASLTTYDQNTLNNNDAYTIGAYTEFKSSEALRVTLRGGFSTYQFQQSSATVQTSDQNSWYASLNVDHQVTDAVGYNLDVGREMQLGTQSDLTEDWYVRPNITWAIIKNLSLGTALFYEHGNQGVGNVTGNLSERYDWYGGQLSLRHELTRCLSIGASYRLTLRSSSVAGNDYSQNVIGLQLIYQFK
jgi:hypothetical protein